MKLIELLATELLEWPSGWFAAAQDDDGLVSGFNTDDITYTKGLGWNNTVDSAYIALSRSVVGPNSRVDDYDTAIVTRAEWEKAVELFQSAPIEPAVTTPALETMLTEWRDLTARAQAAQAEADALFEHAGQCHGEICVRLAELGWGAPRVAAVAIAAGEPVVTLDDDWWKNVNVGDTLTYRIGDGNYHRDDSFTDGQSYRVHSVDRNGDMKLPWELWADGDDAYYWGSPTYFTPSTQQ